MSADGKTIGTIKIENAAIQTPEGGKVIDYRKLRNGIYEAGQAIGTGDAVIDSPYNEAVAKSMVIAPPEVAKPEDPKPDETKPAESKQDPKPEGAKTTKTVAVATTKTKATGVRPSWQPSLREQPLSPQAPWRAANARRRLCAHGSSREGPESQHRLTTPPPSSPPAVAFSICVRRVCTRLSFV